ncbi:DUF6262 family protein [Microbacterium sp. A93]|uniref:DUF6262 family protein n=1 Tax=Microbacterium sp. A93 TaxID=3450716 RepID=UPI003F43D046
MSDRLVAAAQERSKTATEAVIASLRKHEESHLAVSVSSVAADAGVSRNFIYSTPSLRDMVMAARLDPLRQPARTLPQSARSAGSDASLRTRLAAALHRAEQLEHDLAEEKRKNGVLLAEILELQNPQTPKKVQPIRPRRF